MACVARDEAKARDGTMEAKPAPNSEFGAGLGEQKINRKADLRNHIVYDLVCDTL